MGRHAGIWLRKGRGWYATIGGKQIALGNDKDKASKEFHRIMFAGSSGRHLGGSRTNVESLVDVYLDWTLNRVKTVTWRAYRDALQEWVKSYGRLPASEVRPFHVTRWLEQHPRWASPSTQHLMGSIVKIWSSWCRAQGYIDVDRLQGMRLPKIREREPAAPGDLERIIDCAHEQNFRDFLIVLFDTGCRPSEIMSLTADRIDWESSTAKVRGKRGVRVVGLTGRAREALRRRSALGVVLCNPQGKPWNRLAIRRRLDRIEKLAEVEHIVPYQFRHGYWSRATKAGIDSVMIAKQLGHKNLNMLVTRYAHPEPAQLAQAAEAVASHAEALESDRPQRGKKQAKHRRRRGKSE